MNFLQSGQFYYFYYSSFYKGIKFDIVNKKINF